MLKQLTKTIIMNEIIKKNGIQFGIITGAASVLITTLLYVINPELFISSWLGFVKFGIFTIIAITLLTKTKKALAGIFPFKDAFTTYFISAVIGLLIATIFEIVLFHLIDPSLKETLKELSIKFMAEFLQKLGAPSSEIKKAIDQIENTDQFSIGKLVQGFFIYTVLSSIFGLILAAIFKSKSSNQL